MVLVLGMHRSGTSALSGMLCQAGFEAPSDLMQSDEVNPRGYWESQSVYDLNEGLLRELGASWKRPEALPDGWEHGEAAVIWRRRLLHQLAMSYAGASAPLIKDPRFSIMLPALLPWLESGIVSWAMLIPFRHPLEVAHSLEQAQNLPRIEGLRLWLYYIFAAELFSRGHPRLILNFDEIIHNPRLALERCLQLLPIAECDWPDLQASQFVSEDLYRQRRENFKPELVDSLAAVTSVREMALQVYDVFQSPHLTLEQMKGRLDSLAFHWRLLPEINNVNSSH
jgi:hypothetical protein